MARKSKKATASYARREKHRAYGEPLPLAHYVQIPVDQSIKEYLSTLGPDCVAFERYAYAIFLFLFFVLLAISKLSQISLPLTKLSQPVACLHGDDHRWPHL